MKCLSDDNIGHNGNDKNDPEYDKYQIIQSKNDFSCAQLSTMGYDADLLNTEFNEDRIRAAAAEEELDLSVTVANTRERQEALAKATTYGHDPARWTEADDDHLEALRIAPIEMGDTAYGRFEAQKKRDVEIAYQKMSAKEKESFKRKMAEIDETGAGDRQSPPPIPTPV